MPLPRPYIVFDLDGTLVDSAPDLCNALNWILDWADRPPVKVADVRQMVGEGARKLIKKGFALSGPMPSEVELDGLFTAFIDHYGEHLADDTVLFPGARDALEALAADGAIMGICTNKSRGMSIRLLEALEVDHFFAVVLGGDSLKVKKPNPRHLLATVEHLGGQPDGAVMVGDTPTDVEAAQAAGIPVIAVSFGYSSIDPAGLGADALIDKFEALIPALAGLS